MKGSLSRYINRLVTLIKFNPLVFEDFSNFVPLKADLRIAWA